MVFREELNRLVQLHDRGEITRLEVEESILDYLWQLPQQKDEVLEALSVHPDDFVRQAVPGIQRIMRRRDEQIKDMDQIRRTSPLQPGTRLKLSGGYDHGQSWWLNGRDCYHASFIAFAERGADKMPVAVVELEEELDMVEACGQRHKGRYALLSLLFIANWDRKGTVTVHIVETVPTDFAAFYLSHPFGTEIETHATYEITSSDRTAGSGSQDSFTQRPAPDRYRGTSRCEHERE
jgi:hypothetical protein